jgi:hypothetical protein
MKGMLNFLEKAGLVRNDPPAETRALEAEVATEPPPPVQAASTAVGSGVLDAEAVYAHAGVPPSVYPAERLLRLVDGLSAMEPATRLMAIQAMDAADESWTMADPLADAAAKTQALAAHAQQLQASLQTLEGDTQAQLAAVASRQEQVVGDIRKQISELEALVARELSRAAQESASHTAALSTATDHTRRELADIAQLSQRLQSLSAQFGAPSPRPQE